MHDVTTGQGAPLLLLHGTPTTSFYWHRIFPLLTDRFTVVAPDLRGFGYTDKPPVSEGYDSATNAPDGAESAAQAAGRTPADFAIVNENFDRIVAANMAKNGFIKGISSQRPYDQRVAEARLGALALIGQDVADHVVVPPLRVTRDNLTGSYLSLSFLVTLGILQFVHGLAMRVTCFRARPGRPDAPGPRLGASVTQQIRRRVLADLDIGIVFLGLHGGSVQ